jgi:hypothetical protein
MDHFNTPPPDHHAKPRLTLAVDFDMTAYLSQNIASVIDVIDTFKLSDDDAVTLLHCFMNPDMLKAVARLRAQYDIVELIVYTAKKGIATAVLDDPRTPRELKLTPDIAAFDADIILHDKRNYLCEQLPLLMSSRVDLRGMELRRMLHKLGLATWALGVVLGLEYAPRVWITRSDRKEPALVEHVLRNGSRCVLFDDNGMTYAQRLDPTLDVHDTAEVVHRTGILPVPAYNFAQWSVSNAARTAQWMLERGLIPNPRAPPNPLFVAGEWKFEEAVREARLREPPTSTVWSTWLVR